MPWYGARGLGPWFIFPIPILMCIAMMAMMLLMSRGHMGWCGGEHMDEARTDPPWKRSGSGSRAES